jgi:PncC family amidohydrolase
MEKLLKAYKEKGLTLGSVESMTGGLFSAKFTEIPGSSAVFKGGIVTYSSEEKINIVGVKKETIEKYGVVSEEVAKEMAEQGRKLLNVDVCVSVTGNAGPTCEPGGKPVGCYYVGVSSKNGTFAKVVFGPQKRNECRNEAVLAMRDLAYLKVI